MKKKLRMIAIRSFFIAMICCHRSDIIALRDYSHSIVAGGFDEMS